MTHKRINVLVVLAATALLFVSLGPCASTRASPPSGLPAATHTSGPGPLWPDRDIHLLPGGAPINSVSPRAPDPPDRAVVAGEWDETSVYSHSLFLPIVTRADLILHVGQVVHTIMAPPDGVQGIAWDGSHLWVAWGNLYRLDPQSGNVSAQIPSPADDIQGITWDGSHLWVTSYQTNRIYQLNASTGEVVTSFPAPADKARGLAWDGQNLWHTNEHGTLYRISPSGQVLETIQGFDGGPLLAWDGQNLWLGGSPVRRFNLLQRTETMLFPSPATWSKGIAWDGSHIWCAGFSDRTIYRVNVTPGGAIMRGRIVKNGVPLAGLEVEGYAYWCCPWDNRVLLDKTRTDANGEYRLLADPGLMNYVVGWGDPSDTGQMRWIWKSVAVPSEPVEVAVPEVDAGYAGLIAPPDQSQFAEVSPAHPIQFQWSPVPDSASSLARIAEASPYNEIWHSPQASGTGITFDGTLDDGSRIGAGNYLWQMIFNLNNGWQVQSRYRYFTLTGQ